MISLLLDRTTWDLCLDATGNIAVCSEPYRLAQDAACAVKLFLGELYYDTTQGVPYFQEIFGQRLSLPVLKQKIIAAALTVYGVESAQCFITGFVNRRVTGQIQVSIGSGLISVASF